MQVNMYLLVANSLALNLSLIVKNVSKILNISVEHLEDDTKLSFVKKFCHHFPLTRILFMNYTKWNKQPLLPFDTQDLPWYIWSKRNKRNGPWHRMRGPDDPYLSLHTLTAWLPSCAHPPLERGQEPIVHWELCALLGPENTSQPFTWWFESIWTKFKN